MLGQGPAQREWAAGALPAWAPGSSLLVRPQHPSCGRSCSLCTRPSCRVAHLASWAAFPRDWQEPCLAHFHVPRNASGCTAVGDGEVENGSPSLVGVWLRPPGRTLQAFPPRTVDHSGQRLEHSSLGGLAPGGIGQHHGGAHCHSRKEGGTWVAWPAPGAAGVETAR